MLFFYIIITITISIGIVMYQKKEHIHFIGIGGIGMSGIAKILAIQGYRISGCDHDVTQQSIKDLQKTGCIIYDGNNTKECMDTSIEILVYSSAIKDTNPEIIQARQRNIPTIPRAVMLAELMRTKYSIAVAGSHGKTTTSSLISHIMIQAEKNPTIIVGGRLKNIAANAHFGSGAILVAEADESDRSLIYLKPSIALITNIDLEHLDVYADINDIKNIFKKFLDTLPFYGKAIICIDDEMIQSILPLSIKTICYGIEKKADFFAKNILLEADYSLFDAYEQDTFLGTVSLPIPGKHNILNALGALAVAREFNIAFEIIARAFETFKGIERRFSYNGTYKNAEIFDDYGHHPEEIKHTLIISRKRSKNKLIVVFQPHRFTRTQKLWDLFIAMFLKSPIDRLIITDIYAAGESLIDNITSQNLVDAINKQNPSFSVNYVPYESNFESLKKNIDESIEPNDLVLLLGAGKINTLSQYLLNQDENSLIY